MYIKIICDWAMPLRSSQFANLWIVKHVCFWFCFQDIFKMEKEAFNKLPGWKQVNLKKAVRLF